MSITMMIAATGAGVMSMFACEASGNKQEIGAAVGAVVGGVVGNRVADDNRTLGTVVGAAVGALAGQWVGCQLQKRDQQRLAEAAERTIVTGQPVTWTNPETGSSGTVRVVDTSRSAAAETLALAPGVTAPAAIDVVAARYTAPSAINLRPIPGTTRAPVGRIAPGETVDVVGKVAGQPWLLVARNGVGVGYASERLLTAAGTMAQGGAAAGATSVPGSRLCRTIEQTVTPAGGQAQSDRWVACQTGPAAWDVKRA